MRLGLIGAGRWGKVYIQTIEGLGPRLRLTHLATRHPENRALIKESVALFSDWKKLIASDCDAVVIATPAALHAEMTRACLEAGKPCIVEKPLCFDTTTAQALQREAARAGLLVLVNYIHLYNPAVQALKKAIAASGEPIRVILSEGTDLGPFRADVGTLWDRCPHDVALCLDLVGATAPETSWSTEAGAGGSAATRLCAGGGRGCFFGFTGFHLGAPAPQRPGQRGDDAFTPAGLVRLPHPTGQIQEVGA